ncbi:hypothetical protein BGZ80_002041 [Entomortierella chlamydospora]|uniref:FHA domain-containing protein n=1 Tax=Entomortierella chlamydospora TaxID=101097 RepID=A0A9P6MQZ3_9FUNG|nr:hypothetical protein BGZ80_002041 [Entomortierella chlamydospora]
MEIPGGSMTKGMTSGSANDARSDVCEASPERQLEYGTDHFQNLVLSSAIPDVVSPTRNLIDSNTGVIDTLSALSLEQISEMEATLRHIKMMKLQQLNSSQRTVSQDAGIQPSQTPIPSSGAAMHQFMSVMSPLTRKNNPRTTTPPSIQTIDGIPWLTFQYTTRSTSTTVTIRVDIDTISEQNSEAISEMDSTEFRCANCLYPSADGPEQEYKGARRDFERECNEQGRKLAYLNPTILSGKKGLLQQAVVSLRNATAEQKSRRVKRQEKKRLQEDVAQGQAVHHQQQQRQQGPVMALPKITTRIDPSQSQNRQCQGNADQSSVVTQSTQVPRVLSWKPTLVSSLHHSVQPPTSHNLIPRYNPSPPRSDNDPEMRQPQPFPSPRSSQPITVSNTAHALHSPKTILPISSTSFEDAGEYIEFERYFQGRFQKSRIRCDVDHAEYLDESSSSSHHNQQWNSTGVRQAEEAYLNEIGWKLCSLNRTMLDGKRLILHQALDAYRRHFLPATCHPRARVEPSLLTRKSPTSRDRTLGLMGSLSYHDRSRHQKQRETKSQRRVRFHGHDAIQRRPSERRRPSLAENTSGRKNKVDGNTNQKEEEEEEEGEDDDCDDDKVDGNLDAANTSSSENESSESSSSEGDFHSQMSLLTFQGSIRTYSLGTGSGSARSRPRVQPITASRVMNLRSSPSSSPFPLVSATTINRKRPNSGYISQDQHQSQSQGGSRGRKRIRSHGLTEDIDPHEERNLEGEGTQEEHDQTAMESASSNSDVENSQDMGRENVDQDEEEDGWWMSRLQNSEYPEDHNFVSMTTEELIGALTSGYNSDVDDEDEDESEEYSFFS